VGWEDGKEMTGEELAEGGECGRVDREGGKEMGLKG